MDYGLEVAKGTEQALHLLSLKRAEAAFNELLEYASEVCLTHRPGYLTEDETSSYNATDPEQKLVQKLGARSLGTLIEMEHGLHGPYDESDTRPFHIKEMLVEPEAFSDTPNLRILENAERFGQALIDESFAILGKDAPKWAERLRNAKDMLEETAVIDWLDERIQVICIRSRAESSKEDEAAHFYPPFRISPKFIGAHPKADIQPSCLSASIIATSFFQRAGKPTLHAGVMTPANETGTNLLLNTLGSVAKSAERDSYESTDLQAHTIATLAKKGSEWSQRPLAQHAAVYIKLADHWVQFDAYGDATFPLFSEESEQMDKVHNLLEEWKGVMPNLEFATSPMPEKITQLVSADLAGITHVLADYRYSEKEKAALIETISSALAVIPEESYTTYLYEECLKPLLNLQFHPSIHDDKDQLGAKYELEQAETPNLNDKGHYDALMRRVFDSALREFIRWGDTHETFIEKCAQDPHYRRRRAEDFISIPQMMSVLFAQLSSQTELGMGHLSIDIGNPAMRIGLSTLSDFAHYDNDPIPASFWVTHWPGTASLVENLENPIASASDWKLIYNNLLWQRLHPFTSQHNYDKIISFLLEHRVKEGPKDGSEQE